MEIVKHVSMEKHAQNVKTLNISPKKENVLTNAQEVNSEMKKETVKTVILRKTVELVILMKNAQNVTPLLLKIPLNVSKDAQLENS